MAAGNTYVAIAEQTLGSAAASVTFSSIPGTYTDLVLVCSNLKASVGSNNVYVRFNSDTGSNYSYTMLSGNGTTAFSVRGTSLAYNYFGGYDTGVDATEPTTVITNIMNYANATTNKTTLTRFGVINAAGGGETHAIVNLWRSTSAINTILIYPFTGTWSTGSVFTLYGIAAA
jgi:hypothetical protein